MNEFISSFPGCRGILTLYSFVVISIIATIAVVALARYTSNRMDTRLGNRRYRRQNKVVDQLLREYREDRAMNYKQFVDDKPQFEDSYAVRNIIQQKQCLKIMKSMCKNLLK